MHVPFGSGLQGQLVGCGEPRLVGGSRLIAADLQLHLKMASRLGRLRDEQVLYLP